MEKYSERWSPLFIVFSYFVSVMGSFTTLQTLMQVYQTKNKILQLLWIGLASFSMSFCGIWMLHFLGMQALSLVDENGKEVEMFYDPWWTLGSVGFAFVGCFLSFLVVHLQYFVPCFQWRRTFVITPEWVVESIRGIYFRLQREKRIEPSFDEIKLAPTPLDTVQASELSEDWELTSRTSLSTGQVYKQRNLPHILQIGIGSLFLALGVLAMHYTGMLGMQAVVHVNFSWYMVLVSVVLAVTVSNAALLLSSILSKEYQQMFAAMVMAAAVGATHYSAMGGISYHGMEKTEKNFLGKEEVLVLSGILLVLTLFVMLISLLASVNRQKAELRLRVKEKTSSLRSEKKKLDTILHNMLPAPIVERIKLGKTTFAKKFPNVTLMFCDIVNFTEMSADLSVDALIQKLNYIYGEIDIQSKTLGVTVIKIIGDCYFCANGFNWYNEEPIGQKSALRMMKLCIHMLRFLSERNEEESIPLKMRFGCNTGEVAGGVIGTSKIQFDLYGDAVNIASR